MSNISVGSKGKVNKNRVNVRVVLAPAMIVCILHSLATLLLYKHGKLERTENCGIRLKTKRMILHLLAIFAMILSILILVVRMEAAVRPAISRLATR